MPSLERRAWFHLWLVAMAIVAWLLIFAISRSVQASMAGFAVLGLTGVSRPGQRRALLDERDRAIAESSMGTAIRCWLVCSTILPVAIGSIAGWDRTVSFAVLAQTAWIAWIVVLAVQATMTIYKYRSARGV